MYRPSERGVKNELVVHCVGAVYHSGATTSWSPTVAALLVTLCYVDKYKVQTGKRLACGPRLVPLELDTTAIGILRVVTGVTQYLSHTEVISRRSLQTVDLHRFR